jgi:hypothetical protein
MSDDERQDVRPRQVIYDARERVQAARNQLFAELVGRGSVSLRSRRDLAIATVQYWDALGEFREDREEKWDDAQVDEIRSLIGTTVSTTRPAPGDTGALETIEQPALLAADPMELVEASKRLDTLAKDLGFAAAAKQSQHRTLIDNDLMEEVEAWRKAKMEG